MTVAVSVPRLAVLIDADNASTRIAPGLFETIARLGQASVRRIYGDFSQPQSKGWAELLAQHAILPQQQFAYTTGKNSTDIALVIDAMDLLHSGRFDGFCLVSSDSDFTRLAARIREHGVDVFGFGEQKTPQSFRQACLKFFYTESLQPTSPHAAQATVGDATPLKQIDEAIALIRAALTRAASQDGWSNLGAVGSQMKAIDHDFDPGAYGCGKLSELVRKSGWFDDTVDGQGIRIRLRRTRAT